MLDVLEVLEVDEAEEVVGWHRAAEVHPHVLEVPEVADDGWHWVAEVHHHVLEVPEVADNSWYRRVLDVLEGGGGWLAPGGRCTAPEYA